MEQIKAGQRMHKIPNKILRLFAMLVLLVGIVVGMALAGMAVWGDVEATRFDESLSLMRDASLRTLRCPVLLTAGEPSTITARFNNPLDRPVRLLIRTHVSRYLTLFREDTQILPLDPGETKGLAWTVTPDDIVYGHLILVKVLQFRQYPIPGRLASCGIVVLNVPYLTGRQLFVLLLVVSLLGLAGGIALWLAGSRPLTKRGRQTTRTLAALAISVGVGMIVSFLGWWAGGLLFLAANLLLIGAIVEYFVNRPSVNEMP
jgi:hypothetical protein